MSVIVIGGGDKVRQALQDVETNSLTWGTPEREAAEACLNQMASCLKDIADGGDGTAFPFPQ